NRIAYAAVVNEDGGMVDDVTVSVLRDDALLVIGGNPEVFDALNQAAPAGTTVEERRENYGVLSVQGPKSRELLQRLTDADLSNENLPFYGLLTDISIAGVTASIFRVGFTGELGYEVMIGAADAEKLYTAVYAQTDLGVTPFSGGALMIARIEAGFVLADVDYDPAVSPYECSIGFAVDLEKGDFRGREALVARKADAPVRLVGVASDAAPEVFEGAQLSYNGANVGEVVMAVPSPALGGRTLSLVRVANEAATVGTRLIASVGGNDFEAEVVATPAHDPQRLRRRS
ncbi:MAG TPA: aminomethyltransferase family protein, partial [Pseudolysinimonas sp.]|nr:aminomethyltransferase family protein [Pseudolysinimonas sp.]